jgi:hypothetical protein
MKTPKNINYFADEAKNDNTQPKGVENKRPHKEEVVDAEDKAKKRNTIIK